MDLAYIFILLEIFLFFLSFQNYTNDEYIRTISSYVLIFILTVISGFRYNVGRDFLNYEQMYLDPNNFRNLFTELFGLIFLYYFIILGYQVLHGFVLHLLLLISFSFQE